MITSAEEFAFLRNSEHPEEYRRSATDTADLHVWLEVIDRFPDMRKCVARNKTVPVEVLSVLSRDPDIEVRRAVASRNKLSPELCRSMATDPDDSVRSSILFHRNTPIEILNQFALDPDEWMAQHARERLEMRKNMADTSNWLTKQAAARYLGCHEKRVELYIAAKKIRARMVTRPGITPIFLLNPVDLFALKIWLDNGPGYEPYG